MTNLHTAAKLALEALEPFTTPNWAGTGVDKANEAIAALREALAEQSAQRKPLTLGQKQRLWSSLGNKPTLKDRVNAFGLAIEAAHGIGEKK